jgi:hypothetical protein
MLGIVVVRQGNGGEDMRIAGVGVGPDICMTPTPLMS